MSFTHDPSYTSKPGLHFKKTREIRQRPYYRPEQRARILERARAKIAPTKKDARGYGDQDERNSILWRLFAAARRMASEQRSQSR